jgi:hypothetical protein
MGESKRPSRLRRALFDRPILKLLITLLAIGVLFKVVESTSKVWESWPVIGYLIALLGLAVVIYFIPKFYSLVFPLALGFRGFKHGFPGSGSKCSA